MAFEWVVMADDFFLFLAHTFLFLILWMPFFPKRSKLFGEEHQKKKKSVILQRWALFSFISSEHFKWFSWLAKKKWKILHIEWSESRKETEKRMNAINVFLGEYFAHVNNKHKVFSLLSHFVSNAITFHFRFFSYFSCRFRTSSFSFRFGRNK